MSQPLKKTAVVVGAGVAGLSAALELAKSGVFEKVVVVEREPDVGGNVRSRLVAVGDRSSQKRWVDFGALQVFSYYSSLLETVDELGLGWLLEERECKNVVEDRPTGRFVPFAQPFGRQEVAAVANLPDDSFDLYEPTPCPPSVPSLLSMADAFPPGTPAGDALATFFESYTYGRVSELPAYLWLPLVPCAATSKEYTARGRTQFVAWAMRDRIVELGKDPTFSDFSRPSNNVFLLETKVERVDTQTQTVFARDLRGQEVALKYDVLVDTAPAGAVRFAGGRHLPSTRQDAFVDLKSNTPQYRYTSYAAACVRMSSVPPASGGRGWTAAFATPEEGRRFQARCWVNLELLEDLPGAVLFYVYAREASDLRELDESKILELVSQLKFFRGCRPLRVDAVELFPFTMPVVNAAFLARRRATQGDGNVWRAGHYLGSFPTMEVASYWGKVAALEAVGKTTGSDTQLAAFKNRMRTKGQTFVRSFRTKVMIANFTASFVLMLGHLLLALALAAVAFARTSKREQ